MPIHHGSVGPVTSFHDCSNRDSLTGSMSGSCFSCWPSWSPDIGQGQGFLGPTGNCASGDCHTSAHYPGYKELVTWVLSVFALDKYSFISLTGHRHPSSAHFSVMVVPYWWFGLASLAPNTGWKVTEFSDICIAPRVILRRFTSDGLLTVARPKFMAVFSDRHV